MVLASLPRAELGKLYGDTTPARVAVALRTLGGLTLVLLSLHKAWLLSPNGSAKDHLQPRDRFQDLIMGELQRRLSESAIKTSGQAKQVLGASLVVAPYGQVFSTFGDIGLSESAGPASYKPALQTWATRQGAEPQYEVAREGPAHALTWVARARVRQRSGEIGRASSKQAAESAAARNFLSEYATEWLDHEAKQPKQKAPPTLAAVAIEHRAAVSALAAELALPHVREPLLGAALSQVTSRGPISHRRAASGLAQLGDSVLRVRYCRALVFAVASGLVETEGNLVLNDTCSEEALAQAFFSANLDGALLTEAPDGGRLRERARAEALQALAGLLFLESSDLSAFPQRLDTADAILARRLTVACEHRSVDLMHPKALLQELLATLGMTVSFKIAESAGSADDARHRVCMTLRAASGRSISVTGEQVRSRRVGERTLASQALALSELYSRALAGPKGNEIASLLLRDGADYFRGDRARIGKVVRCDTGPVAAWRRRDWQEIDRWFRAASEVCDQAVAEAWGTVLCSAVTWTTGGLPSAIGAAIYGIVAQVAEIDPTAAPLERGRGTLDQDLLACAAATHLLGRHRRRVSVSDLCDELQRFHGRRIEVLVEDPDESHVVERQGTLTALVADLIQRHDPRSLTISSAREGELLAIDVHVEEMQSRDAWSFDPLLLADMPLVSIERAGASALRTRWLRDPGETLWNALDDRDQDRPTAQRAARALHDLKNALSAYSIVAMKSASTQTDRLHRQYKASLHLDEARRVCARLLDIQRSASGPELERVDVGTFLEGYVADLMARLPRHIGFTVTPFPAARADTSPTFLRACLDNLTKNAIEAMAGGGHLTISLDVGEQATISVVDTGPGFSEDQLRALREQRALASTKRSGSALGLASVQSTLSQLGGSLWVEPSNVGAHISVILPLVDT